MTALQAWIVVGEAMRGLGVALVFMVPAVLSLVLGLRVPRGGARLWWGIIVLEIFYIIWQLGRVPDGDPFVVFGLAFPIAILILICRRPARAYFRSGTER